MLHRVVTKRSGDFPVTGVGVRDRKGPRTLVFTRILGKLKIRMDSSVGLAVKGDRTFILLRKLRDEVQGKVEQCFCNGSGYASAAILPLKLFESFMREGHAWENTATTLEGQRVIANQVTLLIPRVIFT